MWCVTSRCWTPKTRCKRISHYFFITSTPQTGIDSLLITYALLGWVFALFRAAVAFISGIICGLSMKLVNTPSYDIDIEKPSLKKI